MDHHDCLAEEKVVRRGKEVGKVWGKEVHLIFREGLVGKIMELKEGFSSSSHSHRLKFESLLVLKGDVLFCLTNTKTGIETVYHMSPGDIIDVHKNVPHRFVGVTDVEMAEFGIVEDDSTGETDNYRFSSSRKMTSDEIHALLSLAVGMEDSKHDLGTDIGVAQQSA